MTIMKCDGWVVIVAPRRSIAAEMVSELRISSRNTGVSIEHGMGSDALTRPKGKAIRVLTAEHLLHVISLRDPVIPLTGLDLVLCENLEQLDATYELGVSLLRHATQSCPHTVCRILGFIE